MNQKIKTCLYIQLDWQDLDLVWNKFDHSVQKNLNSNIQTNQNNFLLKIQIYLNLSNVNKSRRIYFFLY